MPAPTQSTDRTAGFKEPRRSWASRDSDEVVNYMAMEGRVSVASLLAHMKTIAPDVPNEAMFLNYATLKWTEPATEQDRADRDTWEQRRAEKTEAWERDQLVKLIEKYGVPEDVGG